MPKITIEKTKLIQIPDENVNTKILNVKDASQTPSRNKWSENFSTPRTALAPRITMNTPSDFQKSSFKTPLMSKTPLTTKTGGLVMTPMLMKPKKLDFDCFEDEDLRSEKIEPILEQSEEDWAVETGDPTPYETNLDDFCDDFTTNMMKDVVELAEDVFVPEVDISADFDYEAFYESLADKLDYEAFEAQYAKDFEREYGEPFDYCEETF